MFVLMLPLIVGAFGFALDTAIHVYAHERISQATQAAAQAGASVKDDAWFARRNPPAATQIDRVAGPAAAEFYYLRNRPQSLLIDDTCGKRGYGTPSLDGQRCWAAMTITVRNPRRPSDPRATITVAVVERSPYTPFTALLFHGEQRFRVTATSIQGQADE